MRRKQPLIANHYYHIYNRGVNHQAIFLDQSSWILFLNLLRNYFTRDLVDILAYCLMPNHYHLLVYLKSDSFSKAVMQPFALAFVKTINNQHGRVGPLFQGPFKNQLVDSDGYLTHLSRYIHLNPVTAGLVSHPADWEYSSYREYIGVRNGTLPSTTLILGMFEPKLSNEDTAEISKDARSAYADFVCGDDDPRAGVAAGLLIDN